MAEDFRRRAARWFRSVEAAGIAGVVFGVLFIAVVVLLRRQPNEDASSADIEAWLASSEARTSMEAVLQLASFAVIAFLWFVAVIRRRVGAREDRFFQTVFLGSAVIVLALIVVATTVLAAPAAWLTDGPTEPDVETYRGMHAVGRSLLLVHAQALMGVFMITTSTIVLRSEVLPKWLAGVGYLAALAVIVNPLGLLEEAIVFPAWVIAVSVAILVRRRSIPASAESGDGSAEGG